MQLDNLLILGNGAASLEFGLNERGPFIKATDNTGKVVVLGFEALQKLAIASSMPIGQGKLPIKQVPLGRPALI